MDKKDRIFIAGHRGMVGSALLRHLKSLNYENIITKDKSELDLLCQTSTKTFFHEVRPEIVVIAAARVGGIQANINNPADFLYQNLQIQNNLIHHSSEFGAKKVVFLGSSCIYPKDAPQPMKEDYLLDGKLEPTNEGYALAKIAGLKMLEFYGRQKNLKFLSLMPCNLYGPNDSFNLVNSHVLSALVKRFCDAVSENSQSVTLWGTGIARREFMHVDDLAKAILYLSNIEVDESFLNIGWGEDLPIKELASVIANKAGFKGDIHWDSSKPDGMLRKCMNVSKMKEYGFSPEIPLENGIDEMINLYRKSL